MALYNRSSILNSMIVGSSIMSIRSITRSLRYGLKEWGPQGIVPFLLALGFFLQGCGLVFDAVELVQPLARDEMSVICSQGQFRVGIPVEPFRRQESLVCCP